MARTPDLKRRDDLALAAFEVIRERGAQRVTMSDLATALGVKRPTLYWYFKDLGAVFEAVMTLTLRRQGAFVAARLAAARHPVDAVYAWLRAIHDFFDEEPGMLIVLGQFWAAGQAETPDRLFALTRSYFAPVRKLAITQLQAGITAGTVAPCDPAAVVDLVASLTDGALVHHLTRDMPLAPVRELLWSQLLAPLRRPALAAPPDPAPPEPSS